MLDAEGHPESLAGSHPDRLQINFALDLKETSVRDLEFELPAGLGGNPAAVPRCLRVVYENEEPCPPESQVGQVEIMLSGGSKAIVPLFQFEPQPGQAIAFGSEPSLGLPLSSEIRAADFGVTLRTNDLPEEPIVAGNFELWGIPADHQEGTGIPRRPLLTTPSTCGPVIFKFRTRSWQVGAPWLSASADTGASLTGCESLGFDPQLGLQLSNPLADAPTGLRMDLNMPEEDETSERGNAQIENVTVEMPSGIGVSPAGAVGLSACTDVQLGLGSNAEARCPAAAKVGTVEFASPALGDPVAGTVYLGEAHPGQRFRLFVVAPGPGVVFKFVSTLQVDPATGRLSTSLKGLPQVPLRRISLGFDGGPQALLASPLTCGPAAATARFEPYGDGATVESTVSVPIESRAAGGQCLGAAPFSPQLLVARSTSRAGRPTTFSTVLRRQPGEQVPRRFSVTLPAGLSAGLGAVEVCPAAAAATNACPPGSRIAGVLAEVGSGPSPAALHGNVYVTDSYRRAPFGLLMEFPAAIGPFDLGTIAMRGRADLDSHSGRLTLSMDSLPEQLEGVPIRFQSIALNMDRSGLVRNPTSCSPRTTDATLESQGGAVVTVTSPLELTGCNRLGFKPGVKMEFIGRRGLHRDGHPGLRVVLRSRQGDTNLRGMKLSLPPALGFAVSGLKEICSRRDATEGTCPSASRVGTARARTSLLSEPLSGAVYVAQPKGNGPPDLWISLAALGVHVSLRGKTSSTPDGQFVTKLGGMPDIPLSELTMQLGDGESRILSLAVSPCANGHPRRLAPTVVLEGQSGARRKLHPGIALRVGCADSGHSRHAPRHRTSLPAASE
jgi:hypothetical protein